MSLHLFPFSVIIGLYLNSFVHRQMGMFISCTEDYGRQIHFALKNGFDVLKRNIHAVGDPEIDIRPFPNNSGSHFFLQGAIASRLLEIQDELRVEPSK